jgi:hypothetical protein
MELVSLFVSFFLEGESSYIQANTVCNLKLEGRFQNNVFWPFLDGIC